MSSNNQNDPWEVISAVAEQTILLCAMALGLLGTVVILAGHSYENVIEIFSVASFAMLVSIRLKMK